MKLKDKNEKRKFQLMEYYHDFRSPFWYSSSYFYLYVEAPTERIAYKMISEKWLLQYGKESRGWFRRTNERNLSAIEVSNMIINSKSFPIWVIYEGGFLTDNLEYFESRNKPSSINHRKYYVNNPLDVGNNTISTIEINPYGESAYDRMVNPRISYTSEGLIAWIRNTNNIVYRQEGTSLFSPSHITTNEWNQ